MAVTEFGKILRKIRIDHNEVLLNMARKLEVTASYLSAVENGKRNIPTAWLNLLPQIYSLPTQSAEELRQTATAQMKSIKLDLDHVNKKRRDVALAFAQQINELDDIVLEQLKTIIIRKE